jgi:hypothetical protein
MKMKNNVWNILEKKEEYTEFDLANLEKIHDTVVKIIKIVPKEDIRILLDGMNHVGYETFAIMEFYRVNR